MRLSATAHVVLLQKGWQALSGFITALLVTHFLTPDEQGYYYAIGSLLSGYVLFDLGLSGLLVQISARMFSGLKLDEVGQILPDGDEKLAFLALVNWARRWYFKAGLLTLLLIPLGFLYFTYAKPGLHGSQWQLPWVLVAVSVAISMRAYPALSIVEGAGHVAEAYLVRLGHYTVGAFLAWFLLATGLGLYAPAMAPLSVALVTLLWVRSRHRSLFLANTYAETTFPWRETVWPLQRKVALSWLASYVFLYSPTLVIFYFQGAKLAGRLGLSIVVANLLGSLSASWLVAKVPRITHLVVQNQEVESNRLFGKEFRKAFSLMLLGYVIAIAFVALVRDYAIAERILPPLQLGLLFLVFLIFHGISMISVYFRARGREAMVLQNVVASGVSLLASCVLAGRYGISGVLGSSFVIYVVVCMPTIGVVWRRIRGYK